MCAGVNGPHDQRVHWKARFSGVAFGFYRGALPVIMVVVEISDRGSSTIFSAETFIPFLRSETEDGLPSTVNRNEGGTLYSRFSPLGSVRIT